MTMCEPVVAPLRARKGTPMQRVTPSASYRTDIDGESTPHPEFVNAPAPVSVSLARTGLFGALGTTAIVVGAVFGGKSFETHLPGAWFFGMPGGLFGNFGTDQSLPTVASLALVFGGLILLTRVWLGLLRHLNTHPGLPVRRVVLVVVIWSVPLLLAPPLFS